MTRTQPSRLRRRVVIAFVIGALAHFAGFTPSRAQSDNPSFNLVNRGPNAIRELFVTPAGDARWGQNRLQGVTIAPGASYPVRRRIDGNCFFDVRVVFTDGHTEDKREVNTCQAEDVIVGAAVAKTAASTSKPADDPSFRLLNRSGKPIAELFAAPAGLGNWGGNRIGAAPLQTGQTRIIPIPRQGTCSFDLRVVFADHTAKEKRGADLCRITELPVP